MKKDENKKKVIDERKLLQKINVIKKITNNSKNINEKFKKNFTQNIDSTIKNIPKKSFSMRTCRSTADFSLIPYNKIRKLNMEKKLNMIKAKSQILKIAERYMSTDQLNTLKTIERKNTQSLLKNKKNYCDKIQVLGPFLPKKNEEVKPLRKPGFIPNYLKERIKHKANNTLILKKNKKMILEKRNSLEGFTIFQNMLALDNSGKLHMWTGYQWKHINILYESFISICTNRNGYILCINSNFKPGYLMNNRYFQKIDTYTEAFFLKIVSSIKNQIWGINLRGDLLKWNKYEWIKAKKAYGISKLKSLSFDRKHRLWVLDQHNYFYIFDTENKNWMLKNINGNNIKDFDFNENSYLIAVTNEGMIKIYKNKRWIKYGILAEMAITSLHFLRKIDNNTKISN